MIFETYLDDPRTESTVRLCADKSGLTYLFWSDGTEQVFDSLEDAIMEYGAVIVAFDLNRRR